MKNITIFTTLTFIIFIGAANGRRIRRSDDTAAGERELRRTKRNIYQALLKRKDGVASGEFVELGTPTTTRRPQIKRHTREVRFEILLNHKWRDEMSNRTTQEYKLLSGNLIDAISNELNADFNYVTSIAMKFRKGNKEKVLADIASRFFITEVNPERHLQGVVSRGWISGQSVDPNFFKIIAIQKKTGDDEKMRSRPVNLYVKPASKDKPTTVKPPASTKNKENPTQKPDGKPTTPTKSQQQQQQQPSAPTTQQPSIFYLQYKEIDISIKLAQIYQEYLKDHQSPEYLELSGNVEHAVKKILSTNQFFLNCTVIEFSESEDRKVICMMSIKFRHEEKFTIEKCQALIGNGNIDGMPVDDHFFRVNSLGETDEQGENLHALTSSDEKIPQPGPSKYKLKLLPLHYIEIRFSIKINKTWSDELANNQTVRYTIFSGQVEQAVDRALSENPNYIDCDVLEFMESNDHEILTNIAVRLHQNETQPENAVRNILINGTLSGIPVDPSFFAVFSISYRIHSLENSPANELAVAGTEGQKQQAQSTNQTSQQVQSTNQTSPYQNNTTAMTTQPPLLSPCQQQQKNAEDAIDKGQQVGAFVPQCQPDGYYKPVQCHALTGFCWCVDDTGSRLQGTEQRYKEPFCQGIRVHGLVISNTTLLVPYGSCLTIYIQEQVACGDGVDCHVRLTANQTFHNVTSAYNQVPFDFMMPRAKPGTYAISAILNMGWCRSNSLQTSQLVHQGDYHTTDAEDFMVTAQTTDVEKYVYVEQVNTEELGITLHGNIILPDGETTASFGPQSCISMETKLLKACTGKKCGHMPESSNHTVNVLPANEKVIPYEVHLMDLDEGTYVISVVIHTKQCISEDSQAISDGDFYNEDMQEFTVAVDTNDIEKDIPVVKLNHTDDGTSISGRILFPPETTHLLNGSCLSVSSRKLIKCKNNNCKIPPVASKTWEMVEYNSQGLPYSLFLPVSSPGSYLISAVINNGWCKSHTQGVWIKEGDLYNEKIHDFEITDTPQPIGKTIQTSIYIQKNDAANDTTAVVPGHELIINGRVTLPVNQTNYLSHRSCLVIEVQPFGACAKNNSCVIGKIVFHDLHLEGNSIPYYVTATNASSSHYVIKAILNVDWCSDQSNNDSIIRYGDFYNEELDDLYTDVTQTEAECNIDLAKYDKVYENNEAYTITTSPPTYPATTPNFPSVTAYSATENTSAPSPFSYPTATSLPDDATTPDLMAVSPQTYNATTPIYSSVTVFSPPSLNNSKDSNTTTSSPPSSYNTPNLLDNTTAPNVTVITPPTPVVNSGALAPPSTPTVVNNKTSMNASADGLVSLPKGLPRSCAEIRNSGIGSMDGQYIVEARSNCHLSIICQDMEGKNPKEFLGGPNEDEWRYWHFAVLIKISQQDKENIPEGACLEKSIPGQDLLRRILEAGAKQDNPIDEWKSSLAKLLRSRRNVPEASSIITKAKTIYKEMKTSDWGVL